MTRAGQIVLFPFPNTDFTRAKLRPALVVGKLPGTFNDWLICMISTQARHFIEGFDDQIQDSDPDFVHSGLKRASIIRVGRLAVVDSSALVGQIGKIAPSRLMRIHKNLADWLTRQSQPE